MLVLTVEEIVQAYALGLTLALFYRLTQGRRK